LLQSLTDFLVLCTVNISSHPLNKQQNKQQKQMTLLEGEISDFIF